MKKIIPELEKLQEAKSKQEAEVFVGKKGLRTAYEKLISNQSKNDEVLFFYIHNEKYAEESNLFYNSIADLNEKTKNKGICNKDYKTSWFAKKRNYLTMKFIDVPLPGNIDIARDRVLFTCWGESIFSVLIHSKSLAESLRNYFNEMWKIAKK